MRADAVIVRITEFGWFKRRDLDNIAKPILDAMQGIAYGNDLQVRDLRVRWEPIAGSFQALHMSPLVALAFSRGDESLWIRVDTHPTDLDLTR